MRAGGGATSSGPRFLSSSCWRWPPVAGWPPSISSARRPPPSPRSSLPRALRPGKGSNAQEPPHPNPDGAAPRGRRRSALVLRVVAVGHAHDDGEAEVRVRADDPRDLHADLLVDARHRHRGGGRLALGMLPLP